MTDKYSNYFVKFFEIIFSTSKELEEKIEYVNLQLEKHTVIGKNYLRIYIRIKLKDGEFVEFNSEKKYLSYHVPDYEEFDWKSSHPIHKVRQDMCNIYYLLKLFMPNLKVTILNYDGRDILN